MNKLRANTKKVLIVDDQENARTSMAEIVEDTLLEDASLEPVIWNQTILSEKEFIETTIASADAAIFDHHLSSGNFAAFDGAWAVAELYSREFPAILVTTLSDRETDGIRPYRRRIPILLRNGNPQPSEIANGIKQCQSEFNGIFTKDRKPWRTLVRIVDAHPGDPLVSIVIPARSDEEIRVSINCFPQITPRPLQKDDRFFASVNIGASNSADLYFTNFQLLGPISEEYAKFIRD